MKNYIVSALSALALSVTAQAVMYADADYFGGVNGTNNPIGITLNSGGSVTDSFNFVGPDGTSGFVAGAPYFTSPFPALPFSSVLGYIPNSGVAQSGSFTFFLRDPGGVESLKVEFNLGVQTSTSIDFENFKLFSEGFSGNILATVGSSGSINYVLTATTGSFILDAAYAQVNIAPVPEGGSALALLGVAMVGVHAFRRRFSA